MHEQIITTLERCRYSVLSRDDDLDQIFRLRYGCYIAEDSIASNERGIMSDPFDESPNCIHVAVSMDESIVAAVRLHLISPDSCVSPTVEVFPEIVDKEYRGKTLLDPTRFVVRPDARKSRLPLHFLALRIPFLATMFYDVDIALAAVRSEHFAFYVRHLGYQVFSGPRQYPKLNKPVGLLTADVKANQAAILKRYPFFGPLESIPESRIEFPSLDRTDVASGRSNFNAA